MTCPRCNLYVADGSWRCDSCGAVFGTPNAPERNGFRVPPSRQTKRVVQLLAVAVAIAGLGVAALFVMRPGSRGHADNSRAPGETVNVREHLFPGKTTIVDFYSDYCPPCRKIAPLLQKLAARRPDVAVVKLDINRPGVRGIDWGSPLANQFQLRSIPHFQVWDAQQRLVGEGEQASSIVFGMLHAEGLLE